MINANAFLGIPIHFRDSIYIYPPTIKETLENEDFGKFLSLFTISQEDIEDQIFDANDNIQIKEGIIPTPYEYILTLATDNPIYANIIKEGFNFFTKQELTFLPQQGIFLLGNLEEILVSIKTIEDLPRLKEEDYFDFQNAIRSAMGIDEVKPYDYKKHPKKRRMEAKARLRDRIKNKQNSHGNSFLNNLASICCMGIGITPLNIGEMSYAAISILISKYQSKEKYDIDMKILTSGFCSSKKLKPKYWMQENEDK